jgi:5'-methylthioadenosine phosphorylase
MRFGVIGGTGLYDFLTGEVTPQEVATRYGPVVVDRGMVGEAEVYFLPRHGRDHSVPPHRVNYRANLAALQELGLRNLLATAAVGSMSRDMPPGTLALITQFLDFTKCRPSTFFDGEGGVVHTDMSEPYCPHLRQELRQAAILLQEHLAPEATYVCAEGPRFETPAEIHMYRQLGAHLVGMTSVPEVVLAREAGLCYASVAIVTNWAAGVVPEPLRHEQVSSFMAQQTPRLIALFRTLIRTHTEIDCPTCRGSHPA